MTAVFADTSFYVALANPRDALHSRAQDLAAAHGGPVVTTEYVLVETANFLSRAPNRAVFVALLGALEADPQTTTVAGSHERFAAGCARYRGRPDKDWSLTDCLSFLAMEEHGLTDALTADHHFEQAGFRALLRQATRGPPMKIQFDSHQDYQLDAIQATVDVFDGQPLAHGDFEIRFDAAGGEIVSELGIGNNLTLSDQALLANVQAVQERNGNSTQGSAASTPTSCTSPSKWKPAPAKPTSTSARSTSCRRSTASKSSSSSSPVSPSAKGC